MMHTSDSDSHQSSVENGNTRTVTDMVAPIATAQRGHRRARSTLIYLTATILLFALSGLGFWFREHQLSIGGHDYVGRSETGHTCEFRLRAQQTLPMTLLERPNGTLELVEKQQQRS